MVVKRALVLRLECAKASIEQLNYHYNLEAFRRLSVLPCYLRHNPMHVACMIAMDAKYTDQQSISNQPGIVRRRGTSFVVPCWCGLGEPFVHQRRLLFVLWQGAAQLISWHPSFASTTSLTRTRLLEQQPPLFIWEGSSQG